jgi:hypothetical protein
MRLQAWIVGERRVRTLLVAEEALELARTLERARVAKAAQRRHRGVALRRQQQVVGDDDVDLSARKTRIRTTGRGYPTCDL